MRTSAAAVVAILVMVIGGCSSSGPAAVDFSHPQAHGRMEFTAAGAAVDDGVMCPQGAQETDRLENMEGSQITDEEWADMFDAAMADGSVAEMMVYTTWTCDDGSGAFTMEFDNRFDFSVFEFEGQQDVGTWTIVNGTGSYAGLTGSGDVVLDLDAEAVNYGGELEAP
jgi:hypothetical protein